jgi:thiol:disulfide interchange protein
MKQLCVMIIMITGMLLTKSHLKVQDTASTKDLVFTPIATPPPAAKITRTNTHIGRSGISGNAAEKKVTKKVDRQQKQTLWAIFLAGMAGGLAALLMPCIFPMLPLTVSYFTKTASNKGNAVLKALLYGVSIIVIYVMLGLVITIMFGADALNCLATNGFFNFGFFLLIVAFAASFLGAFELTCPANG